VFHKAVLAAYQHPVCEHALWRARNEISCHIQVDLGTASDGSLWSMFFYHASSRVLSARESVEGK
jgi:hypothetical protein